MGECCRGNKYEGAGWELNDELQVPQHQVPTGRVVEIAQRLDGAPAEGEIEDIAVPERPDVRAEIECRTGKYCAHERAA